VKVPERVVEVVKLPEPTPPVVVAPPDEPKPAPPAKPKVVVENPPPLAPMELMPELPQAVVAAPPEPPKPVIPAPPAAPVVVSKPLEIRKSEPARPAAAPLVMSAPESPKRLDLAPRPAAPVPAPEPKRLDLAGGPAKPAGPSRIEFNAVAPKLTERAPRPAPVEAPRPLVAAAPAEAQPLAEAVRSAKHDVPAAEPAEGGTSFKGVIRQAAQMDAPTLDADTVRRAVDDMCRGRAFDVRVVPTAGRQLTVAVRVRNQGEWDRLCKDIKALPEVSGYSIIYNVTVAGAARRDEPLPGGPSAPLMGVLRSATTVPAVGPDAVQAAIESACHGRAEDVSVRPNARQQVAVALRVRSAAEWDRLYKDIKALPEVAGYAVIYNVSVKAN
jgi:hypothetical protein